MASKESTFLKLQRLALIARQIRSGAIKGERRSRNRGTSTEFADYRSYVPGDDLRMLDWKVFARMEKPFIKLLEEEEDLSVTILLDNSASMDWGNGEKNKFTFAKNLAGGLGAITLGAGDQLKLIPLLQDQPSHQFGPSMGSGTLFQLLQFLEQLIPGADLELEKAIHQLQVNMRKPGLVILISDLLFRAGLETPIRKLQSQGNELVIIHILSNEELEPELAGDLRLIDSETNHSQEVNLNAGIRSLYKERVDDWLADIKTYCQKRDIRYSFVSSESKWETYILRELRIEGIAQ